MAPAAVLFAVGLSLRSGTEAVHAARACPTVSGYIYHDANDNGLRDPGEPSLGGGAMELRDSEGNLVGSTVANDDGYYEFFFDGAKQASQASSSFVATFPDTLTNWSDSREAPAFDTDDGTLVAVEIGQTATITSSIAAESLDSEPTSLTATVSGEVLVGVGKHTALAVPEVQAGQFDAEAYDGTSDWAGPSGRNFGQHAASDSSTVTVQGVALEAFTGPEPVVINATVEATSNTSGSGNVLSLISTTARVDVTLTYQFIPYTCLIGAGYAIVQIEQPDGYADGRETAGNQTPIPDSGSSDEISVTVGGEDLPNNDFGELTGSLAGFVYLDTDNDGILDSGELLIPGVGVRLVGRTASGGLIDATMKTLGDGSYLFDGLVAGEYEILEVQPSAYMDGKDTIGSQGGETANDDLSIDLPAGVNGVQNNFGELIIPTATATQRTSTIFPSLTPTPDGATPERDYDIVVAQTPGAPDAGGGLAVVGASGINLFLAVVFFLAVGAGVLLMMLGRSEPAPRR